jgi:hypothetical protein
MHDESMPISNSSNHLSSTNDFENVNGDDDSHGQHHQIQQKSIGSIGDVDCYDASTSLLDPQLAAYRAIMSRMIPFANHINGNNSPRRHIKQEPLNNADESSQGNESDSSSPIDQQSSP